MPWFKKDKPVAVVEPVIQKPVHYGPRLAVLTPDIAGISSFRLNLADCAPDAEELVAGLRADVRRGTHAFWAMHERPVVDESMHVEALVLIRAKNESDLVYVVSFLDLESALSFTRFEVRRGLYIGNVMVYWAAFAQIREEIEGVTILPNHAPPSVQTYLGPDPRIAPEATPEASIAIAEPEPQVESIAEAEARQAVERYLTENPEKAEEPVAIEDIAAVAEPPVIDDAPPVLEQPMPIFDDEPVTEEAAVADALVLQHPPVAEPVAEVEIAPEVETPQPDADAVAKRRQGPWAPKRKWSTRERRQQVAREKELVAQEQPEVVAQTAPEVVIEMPELVAKAAPEIVLAPEPLTEEQADHQALEAIAERVSTFAGDEEAESAAVIEAIAPEIEAVAPVAQVVDPAAGLPTTPSYQEFDIAIEVERLLKNRKWESREGPFRGFKSPPGRF